jgi:lipid A disaccharide synthetase
MFNSAAGSVAGPQVPATSAAQAKALAILIGSRSSSLLMHAEALINPAVSRRRAGDHFM